MVTKRKQFGSIVHASHSEMRGARKAFQVFDSSGDKRVSKGEMGKGLRKVGVECLATELDEIFARFDLDQSGELSFGQFVKLLAAVESESD